MNRVNVMLGFDCDYPRGPFIKTSQGIEMAEVVLTELNHISTELPRLGLQWTYFICGLFLSSMIDRFGQGPLRDSINLDGKYCEIGDHTYSHKALRFIPTRADKEVIRPVALRNEYRTNTELFNHVFGKDLTVRGFRAPYGYYKGLCETNELLDVLLAERVLYISADLRDKRHSIHPPLLDEKDAPRRPYYYQNGLLEIPGHGWQDTVFGGFSRTPIFDQYPLTYVEMIEYYRSLLCDAIAAAELFDTHLFLGLSLHPYNVALYDPERRFFQDFRSLLDELGVGSCQYVQVSAYFKKEYPRTSHQMN